MSPVSFMELLGLSFNMQIAHTTVVLGGAQHFIIFNNLYLDFETY